jgi:hypothetical protein
MEESLPQLILPIKMERSSERLTSLGGLVVLEELAQALGLWEEVDRALEGPKSGRGYRPREIVQALVWMLHAGGRRLEDLRGELGALNLSLVKGIQKAGGRVLVLGEGGDLRADSRTVLFLLPTMPLCRRPLLEIVPVQLLAYKLAERQDYSPGTVRHLSKVITSELGIPQSSSGLR